MAWGSPYLQTDLGARSQEQRLTLHLQARPTAGERGCEVSKQYFLCQRQAEGKGVEAATEGPTQPPGAHTALHTHSHTPQGPSHAALPNLLLSARGDLAGEHHAGHSTPCQGLGVTGRGQSAGPLVNLGREAHAAPSVGSRGQGSHQRPGSHQTRARPARQGPGAGFPLKSRPPSESAAQLMSPWRLRPPPPSGLKLGVLAQRRDGAQPQRDRVKGIPLAKPRRSAQTSSCESGPAPQGNGGQTDHGGGRMRR